MVLWTKDYWWNTNETDLYIDACAFYLDKGWERRDIDHWCVDEYAYDLNQERLKKLYERYDKELHKDIIAVGSKGTYKVGTNIKEIFDLFDRENYYRLKIYFKDKKGEHEYKCYPTDWTFYKDDEQKELFVTFEINDRIVWGYDDTLFFKVKDGDKLIPLYEYIKDL